MASKEVIKDQENVQSNPNAENQAPATKVKRRGVASARGTQRLKFSHEHAQRNGLFLGHLHNVEVSMISISDSSTGMPSFNGMEIPKIVFTFCSNEDDATKRRFTTVQFTAVESNVNTIPGGKEEWKVNTVFDYIQHFLNVYILKGREFTDEEAALFSLPFEDFDEDGSYVSVEPEEVVAGWKTMFENVENVLNRGKDGQPAYNAKDGKFITVWIKLLRHVKNMKKKEWVNVNNGDLSFPTFVGEGVIEVFKQGVAPSIRIDTVKESIIPIEIKAKSNTTGNSMGAPAMGGVPVDPMMGGQDFNAGFGSEASGAAMGGDLPF